MPAHAIYAVLVISMPFFVTQLVTAKDVADKIDGDIPYDWQDYITIKNETLTIHEVPTLELSSSLFQGDIAEIQPNETAFNALALRRNGFRWPDGLVPFKFSPFFPVVGEIEVRSALKDLEDKTCIQFIPRTHETDYLLIDPGPQCWSFIGRQGGPQIISIGNSCWNRHRAIQHQFLHSLGLLHEITRSDRKSHVWINKKNISDGIPTILREEKDHRIGQGERMSTEDLERVNLLYKCSQMKKVIDFLKNSTKWSLLCDGKVDTPGGWDENPGICTKLCGIIDRERLGSFELLISLPDTRRCIKKTQLCSGMNEMDAGVFENKTACQSLCAGGGFLALEPTFQCVHFSALCDGRNNTRDGSDEIRVNCVKHCRSDVLQYYNGKLYNSPVTKNCMMGNSELISLTPSCPPECCAALDVNDDRNLKCFREVELLYRSVRQLGSLFTPIHQ